MFPVFALLPLLFLLAIAILAIVANAADVSSLAIPIVAIAILAWWEAAFQAGNDFDIVFAIASVDINTPVLSLPKCHNQDYH